MLIEKLAFPKGTLCWNSQNERGTRRNKCFPWEIIVGKKIGVTWAFFGSCVPSHEKRRGNYIHQHFFPKSPENIMANIEI